MIGVRSLVLVLVFGASLVSAVESRVCVGCHREIYERYRVTPMARTSGVVDAVQPASFRTTGGQEYRVSGSSYSFDFEGGEVRRTLNYFLGAGVTGRSFVTSIDGFLYQAPISYYASTRSWDLSPGYVESEVPNLVRAVEPNC